MLVYTEIDSSKETPAVNLNGKAEATATDAGGPGAADDETETKGVQLIPPNGDTELSADAEGKKPKRAGKVRRKTSKIIQYLSLDKPNY